MSEHQPGSPYVVCQASGLIEVVWPAVSGLPRTRITESGHWPTWNPTRDLIAYSVLGQDGGRSLSSVELADLSGRHLRTLHEAPPGVPPFIAPRVPHYCMWSPGGDVIAIVAQGAFGLTLFLSDIDGLLQSDAILNAAPLFSAWCTDNNFLAVHAGTEFEVIEAKSSRRTAQVATGAIGFRTPAYSDDADFLAYALPSEGGVSIWRAHFQGTGGTELGRFAGGTALAFRPGSRDLSVAVARQPDSGVFDELWLVDVGTEGSPAERIARGPFVGVWWAPDGEKVALLVPMQMGDGRYAVQVRDAAGHLLAATEGFVPSDDFRIMSGFFDQYSLSHQIWAPDSSGLLFSGRLVGEGVSSSWGDPAGDYVLYWPAERGSGFAFLGPGQLALFPPKPKRLYES